MELDLLVTDGEVIDGSGSPARSVDVGVRDGRLLLLPPGSRSAATVVNARGLVVTPGFIDVHTHSDLLAGDDEQRETLRLAPLRQGVTTEICGNCGISPFPVPAGQAEMVRDLVAATFGPPAATYASFAEFAAAQGAARRNHLATLVGHGTLRAAVVGFAQRRATADELRHMCALLDEALTAGAAGLSTGLIYSPGVNAGTDEVIALARVAAAHGKPYVTHLRDEMSQVESALEEAIEIATAAGAALQVSHHKTAGRRSWGATVRTLARLERARAEGLDVLCDVYPYTAGSTALHALLPPWVIADGVPAMLTAVREATVRDRIRADLAAGLPGWENTVGNGGWDLIRVASAPTSPEVEGHTIADLAAARGVDPVDWVCDLLAAEAGNVTILSHSMREDDVRRVLASPLAMLCSDGVPKPGRPHPRWAGSFARVLGHYVRDVGLLSLTEAVHKMTGMPAHRFGLTGRGLLADGYAADLVVLDPAEAADGATYDDPLAPPRGVRYVVVDGRVVVDGDRVTEARPGRVLAVADRAPATPRRT
ncbi:N-acyl-D-amino-acid deacylase family protein [Micromonospora sp. LH3U1]|uniref:N-acyl-D-amino-acid deacylase family protein n=1 Tax=Micromonospora sp. LH3U1 TaxID=3018339 RepID=UPI0023495FE0|nr:amidohydrolase family protein [Micromonospora sp. LH3U1]WCN83275.1 amidohydrolase family protein [Micromonospora sp. LH3U1]